VNASLDDAFTRAQGILVAQLRVVTLGQLARDFDAKCRESGWDESKPERVPVIGGSPAREALLDGPHVRDDARDGTSETFLKQGDPPNTNRTWPISSGS
jgi:hypothetical protein